MQLGKYFTAFMILPDLHWLIINMSMIYELPTKEIKVACGEHAFMWPVYISLVGEYALPKLFSQAELSADTSAISHCDHLQTCHIHASYLGSTWFSVLCHCLAPAWSKVTKPFRAWALWIEHNRAAWQVQWHHCSAMVMNSQREAETYSTKLGLI